MMKLLTLVIPTYNMEAYLPKCLSSLVIENKELMNTLEVLVVNDGSTDRSSEIAHEYAVRFPDVIRAIDKENGNYGTCVNRGLAEATGKYFKMLDADDSFDKQSLITLLHNLSDNDADLVITESEDRRPDGSLIFRMTIPEGIKKGEIIDATSFDSIKAGFKYLFCSHVMIYKTEILRQIGLQLEAGISYTDNEYVFFPLDRIKTMIFYDLPLYQYLVGREGQTTQQEIMYRDSWQIMKVFNKLFDHYNKNKNNNSESVKNNQRLVLSEMMRWVYRPLFLEPYTSEKKSKLHELESFLSSDKLLFELLDDLYVNGHHWLRLYRKRGIYVGDPQAILWKVNKDLIYKLRAMLKIRTRLMKLLSLLNIQKKELS